MLESGKGGLGVVDVAAGRYEGIAELPGFTRGLDFCGHLAFVGLSQVRESAVFSGIPIAERALAERNCGVWVVDIITEGSSLTKNYYDQFRKKMANPAEGYPNIVQKLKEKIAKADHRTLTSLIEKLLSDHIEQHERGKSAGKRK